MVCYREPHRETPPVRIVAGARFRAVCVARGGSLRSRLSAYAAAETLAREGVRCAVFPPDYAFAALFARRGVMPPPLVPLHLATAAAIIRRCMAQQALEPSRATLAFLADAVTPELRRAVWALAGEARYIALAVPGGETLARALKRERGVAARLLPPDGRFCADLTAAFSPCAARNDVLPLCDPALEVRYEGGLPPALLAALWAMGAVDAEGLAVRVVERP